MKRSWALLPLFLLLAALPAITGATIRPGDWYDQLIKPPGTPPAWIFGPVWTTLYACIGLAGWRMWTADTALPGRRPALLAWLVQLGLNAAWTPIVFGLHRLGLGLIVLALLGLAIVACIRLCGARDRLAGWLLAPYLAWVCYAGWLNAGLWWLNSSG